MLDILKSDRPDLIVRGEVGVRLSLRVLTVSFVAEVNEVPLAFEFIIIIYVLEDVHSIRSNIVSCKMIESSANPSCKLPISDCNSILLLFGC